MARTGFIARFVNVVVAVILLAAGCEKKESATATQAKTAEAIVVSLANSRVEPVQRTVEVVGTLFGDEEAVISAKVPGRIVQIMKDMGDRAAAGDVLAQIDKTDYDLEATSKDMAYRQSLAKLGLQDAPPADFDLNTIPTVQRAKLQAANAEAKFERAKKLYEQKPPLMSEQDYADLKTAYDVARSESDVELLTAKSQLAEAKSKKSDLDMSNQRLADTSIKAPPPGAISKTTQPAGPRYAIAARLVSVGEYVREGTPLFRLVADNPIKYRPAVPERYISQLKLDQEVTITVNGYPDQKFVGKIARISPQVDALNRTFQIEILVPNPKGLLQPGSFAKGSVQTYTDPNVTFVPLESVISFAGVNKIFTVKDGKAVEMNVETGIRRGNYVEITKGLSGEVPIVVSGASKLAGGVPVQVNAPPTSPTTQTASTN
ncbi:MAG TPA: efflux RND transporter periplasmic adaptor subunit [Tepidisphaeraceae bacterium]|jgi:RND family efflux transporter MFP subunit|nr:efflux RND transporter periplasmic adaptor subunit [Tepidisphaeraceae bacterium]